MPWKQNMIDHRAALLSLTKFQVRSKLQISYSQVLSLCLPLRWPSGASGPVTLFHLPSGTYGRHQWQQRHPGELWPRPSRPGIVQRARPGGVWPAASPLLRGGAQTPADDQEGPQDAGPQRAEGKTSPTIHLTCVWLCKLFQEQIYGFSVFKDSLMILIWIFNDSGINLCRTLTWGLKEFSLKL